ncbi:MAG TPA: hypothetical protein VGM51_14915 [Armatimonadota bacterium]|jgi:hypothetical protein
MKIPEIALVAFGALNVYCTPCAHSAEPPLSRSGKSVSNDATLKALVPKELDVYNASAKNGTDAYKAAAAVNLLRASKGILLAHDEHRGVQRSETTLKAELAYMSAWEKAIQTWKRIGNAAAGAKIMAEWNSGLKEGAEACWQIDALWSEWDPAFLTDPLVKLLRDSNDPRTIGAIAHLLGYYGQDAEERLLKEKLASISANDPAAQMNVTNIGIALTKISDWKAGDRFRTGPAVPSQK